LILPVGKSHIVLLFSPSGLRFGPRLRLNNQNGRALRFFYSNRPHYRTGSLSYFFNVEIGKFKNTPSIQYLAGADCRSDILQIGLHTPLLLFFTERASDFGSLLGSSPFSQIQLSKGLTSPHAVHIPPFVYSLCVVVSSIGTALIGILRVLVGWTFFFIGPIPPNSSSSYFPCRSSNRRACADFL